MSRTVTYGVGSLGSFRDRLPDPAEHVLVVSGRASFEKSGAADQLGWLLERPNTSRWSDFAPNTDISDLAEGIEAANATAATTLVAVGGGSVMDIAKLICAYRDVGDRSELEARIRSGGRIERRQTGLLVAPTTAGSGSESTHFAVVYIGAEKFSIAGEGMRADAVALDPLLAVSGSPHQRATSGMDAICQAIESSWAAGSTPSSRRFARHALGLLLPAVRGYVAAPDNENARAMSLGSHLAGRAIDVSKTTAAHALSYGITKMFGVDHGNAAALTLGAFLDRHATASQGDLQETVDPDRHAGTLASLLRRLDALPGEARTRFVGLLDDVGLPATLEQVGAAPSDLDHLAQSVNAERLGNNPVRLDHAQLVRLLGQSLGRP